MKALLTTVLLLPALLSTVKAQLGTFTEHHTLHCADSVMIGQLGFPSWAPAEIVQDAQHGTATLSGGFGWNTLTYWADPSFEGKDTVIVKCAHATQITCDTGIFVFQVVCDSVPVGISEIPVARLLISPNPAQDIITVEGVADFSELTATDQQGRNFPVTFSGQPNQYKINHLPSGIYILKFQKNGKVALGRFVVLR